MTENRIDIGILEERDPKLLHPRFFPSKVGGKPAWLDLKSLPSSAGLSCRKCGDPLVFLCQVYAPYEESDECFHRTIFVFVCRNGSCCSPNNADNFVVLRCQLQRKNDFYSFEPYNEDKVDEPFPMEKWCKLCEVCGSRAPSHCSKCKKSYYCSRKHQVLDWQKQHKEICADEERKRDNHYFQVTPSGKNILFKEWELIVDEEDEENIINVDENKEMEKLRKMIQEKKAGTLSNISESELEQYAKPAPEDKVFNKFSKRVSRHPDQVLRYDRGGTPLWITEFRDKEHQIPNCEHCGSVRQFEFQIMPQLLNFIDVGIEFNSIDWGVLVVYTCAKSCSDGPQYRREFLVKQDLLQQ